MVNRSVRITCPKCNKKLKAAGPIPTGMTTVCPFCGCKILLRPTTDVSSASSGVESEIMPVYAQSEKDEIAHLRSSPARNPIVYALGGAAVVVLIGLGMFAAYMAGQSGSTVVAERDSFQEKPSATTIGEQGPIVEIPSAKQSRIGVQPQNDTPITTRVDDVADSPNNANAVNDDNPGTFSQGSNELGTTVRPNPDPQSNSGPNEHPAIDDIKATNDSNRPKKDPFDLVQPIGGNAGRAAMGVGTAVGAVIVEIPVLVPFFVPINNGNSSNIGTGSSNAPRPAIPPDLNVVIRPEDMFKAVIKVDHLSKPGISTKLVVSLDATPKTDVQINVSGDLGLMFDPATLTFSANVVPIQQVITITGDGKAAMPRGPSKVFYLSLEAKGGGMKASSPARIPVQVMRRSAFLTSNGLAIVRNDVRTTPGPKSDLSGWTFNIGVGPQKLLGEQYTNEYVQLVSVSGQSPRFRLYEDRIELEIPAGSGTYKSQVTGSWY
jgi:DNA-directed RNA polymerase subunit RPC12/RpoP